MGNMDLEVTYRLADLPPTVAAKIEIRPSGCWLWTGAVGGGGQGYGMLTFRQVVHRAHRFVYELLVGPIPEGLELDHLCRVTRCVNPEHLEAVTHQTNTRRHYEAAPACKSGHLWTPENTYRRLSTGRRECRSCNREKQRQKRGDANG